MTQRPSSIALVDIGYLFKKHWHLNDGTKNAAARGALRDLERLSTGEGAAERVIVCRDWPPYKRKEVYAEYKAHRPEREPEELAQMRFLGEEMVRLGFSVAGVKGYEADDVIATLAKAYGEWCSDVRIVGPDKDCSQCITTNVKQYIPPPSIDKDWQVRDAAGVISKFGVPPAQMAMFQALWGDAGDNIPGVEKVGEKTARELTIAYRNPTKLAEALPTLRVASVRNCDAIKASLIANWEKFILSLKLVTLDTNVPLDAEALLVQRAAEPPKEDDSMSIGNDNDVQPHPGFDEAVAAYQAELPKLQQAEAARSEETEEHYEEERRQNEEHVDSVVVPRTQWAAQPETMQRRVSGIVPAYTRSQYGMVTSTLQPLDLQSAETLAKWLAKGELYVKRFKNSAQIFTIIQKARELGLPLTTVLDNYHIVEGKPTPSADLIRALAERDPNFDYLMPIEQTPMRCVWEGKNKRHPRPVPYAYTIEDARAAGLVKSFGNWVSRPMDMLNKTAASKLARQLWPGATMGLYCLEEMGYDAAELEAA